MLTLTLLACSSVTCGPGTVLEGDTCVVDEAAGTDADTGDADDTVTDSADTGGADTGDTGGNVDSGGDTATAADGWPLRFFAPYVDATAYPTVKVGEIGDVTGARYYTLGFVVAQGPGVCVPTWGTYYGMEVGPSAWEDGREYTLYQQIDLLRASGGDVWVSFGGAANTPVEAACGTTAEVVEAYEQVIDTLSLTRVDVDIEGPWIADAASIARRSEALAELKARRPGLLVWYTLPVLPSGLTADGLRVVQSALDHGLALDGVNLMTMDYGPGAAPSPAGRMGEYGIEAVTAVHAQLAAMYGARRTEAELWGMLGSTPMIGQNDVAGEVFDLEDAAQTRAFAEEVGLGMLSMWSTNRDRACPEPSEWARADCHNQDGLEAGAYSRALGGR